MTFTLAPRPVARRRTSRTTAALLAGLVALAPACNTVGDAVDDAREAVEEGAQLVQFCTAALRVVQAVNDDDMDKAVSAGEDMVQHAPDEIASEAQTVLDGAKQAQGGDLGAVQSEEFQQAARAVEDFTTDRCDPR